jgi:hypothetical protein
MKKIFISTLLTFLVSGLFGLIFNSLLVFSVAIILQILFFFFFNSAYESYLIQKVVTANIEYEKEKLKKTVTIPCPCSENNMQDVFINVGEDVTYNCEKCKKDVRAVTNVGTSLVTAPIYTKQ